MALLKLVFIVSMSLSLTACATTTPADLRRADEARCRFYGFRAGSDSFSRCLLDLDLSRAADRRQRLDYPYGFGGPWYWGRVW
jgi:hypothetical protein